jgi:hypothetical protein
MAARTNISGEAACFLGAVSSEIGATGTTDIIGEFTSSRLAIVGEIALLARCASSPHGAFVSTHIIREVRRRSSLSAASGCAGGSAASSVHVVGIAHAVGITGVSASAGASTGAMVARAGAGLGTAVGDNIRFHVLVVAAQMSALSDVRNFVFELVKRQSGFDSLVMDNRSIGNVLVDVTSGMRDGRSNCLALDERLDSLVNVVVRQMRCVGTSLNGAAFSGGNLLVISEAGMLLTVTRNILFRHLLLMVTVFGFEVLVLVLGWQNFGILDWLNAVLMMVNLALLGDIVVYFLLLGGSNGLVGDFRINLRLNCCVVVFSRSENLLMSLKSQLIPV